MKKIWEGVLLGTGIFIAFNVMALLSTLAMFAVSYLFRIFMTSGFVL